MRPFELILVILTLIIVLFGAAHQRNRLRATAAVWAGVLLLHLWLEGARWQMQPVYLVGLFAAVAGDMGRLLLPPRHLPRLLPRLGRVLGALLVIAAAGLSTLFPVTRLAALEGPHAIGTLTFDLVDPNRLETYGERAGQPRELVVQVWYPAAAAEGPRSAYIPSLEIGGPAIAAQFGLPPFLLNHVNLIQTRSHIDAPPDAAGGPYPLLLFSHGLRGVRMQNSEQIEELVSQGYIVAATDHVYAAAFTVYPDGRAVLYDDDVLAADGPAFVPSAQRLVDVWATDLGAILDRLTAYSATADHPLAGLINLDQVGVFGQSTGGGAAYEFCYRDGRCGAALGLDPWVVPTSDAAIDAGLPVPTMIMRSPTPVSRANEPRLAAFWDAQRAPAYQLVVAGSEHYDFTDFKRLSPALSWIGMTGSINPDQMHAIQSAYTRAFFDYHLRGWNGSLLFVPAAQFPQVTLERR